VTDNAGDSSTGESNAGESAPPAAPKPTPRQTATGSMLAAAMLGLGEVIEPEKTRVEIAIEVVQAKEPDAGLDLDFGELPEL
jgi:hypothetical protein